MPTLLNPRRAEHDELRRIMVVFSSLMSAKPEVDHAALVRERMVFSRTFIAHLAHEHEEITDLMRSHPCLVQKAKARGAMIAGLRADYSEHVRRWTPAQIKKDWFKYKNEVLALQEHRAVRCNCGICVHALMDLTKRERLICYVIGIASPVAFFALIRLLPNGLTASDSGVLVRQIAIIVIPILWLIWLVRRSPLSAKSRSASHPLG